MFMFFVFPRKDGGEKSPLTDFKEKQLVGTSVALLNPSVKMEDLAEKVDDSYTYLVADQSGACGCWKIVDPEISKDTVLIYIEYNQQSLADRIKGHPIDERHDIVTIDLTNNPFLYLEGETREQILDLYKDPITIHFYKGKNTDSYTSWLNNLLCNGTRSQLKIVKE